jgi:hypothetical protein
MCVPSLVEIAPGVPELCLDIHKHTHAYTQTSIFIGIDFLLSIFLLSCEPDRTIWQIHLSTGVHKIVLTHAHLSGRSVPIHFLETHKSKSKAILVIGRGGLWGCRTLRIPYYLDNQRTDGGKVISPTHLPRSIPQKH